MENRRLPQSRSWLAAALLACMLAAALCLLATPRAAHAELVTQEGQITVTFEYDGEAVPGGTLMLYRIGDANIADSGAIEFTPVEELAADVATLTGAESEDVAEKLLKAVRSAGIKGESATVSSDGTVVFGNVVAGMYLVEQTEAASGYKATKPFTVTVPAEENGVYNFAVSAYPKVQDEDDSDEVQGESSEPDEEDEDEVEGESSLPQTGQLNWPVPVLAVAGILLIALGIVLRGRRNSASK